MHIPLFILVSRKTVFTFLMLLLLSLLIPKEDFKRHRRLNVFNFKNTRTQTTKQIKEGKQKATRKKVSLLLLFSPSVEFGAYNFGRSPESDPPTLFALQRMMSNKIAPSQASIQRTFLY